MDWSGCDMVEVVEGKVTWVPLMKRTRIPADFVVESDLAAVDSPQPRAIALVDCGEFQR